MATLSEDQIADFTKNGYLIVENFLTDEECDVLRARCHEIVDKEDFHPTTTFTTTGNSQASTDYFLRSGDKIRYFFEEKAVDDEGKLKVPKHKSLNKIGHALHVLDEEFHKVTFSDKVKGIVRAMGLTHPAVVQSMYIFKQPSFGGSFTPHQDLTFLYNTPNTLVGFWIALEDADIENSCLWFIPGSHERGCLRRIVRTMEDGNLKTVFDGPNLTVSNDDFVASPVKKGTLVLIHGTVIHKSEENRSDRSRHVYTFHLYDAGRSEWNKDNWLQPMAAMPFPHLY